ncbi:Gfo/Idh/MocA family oxidoreductase [Lacibacter sp.]|uniref:Gfo/Idh/MocA family protein n=1 Tax=Lacibacter sp. TaxID=1915409 RepID=UPI002B4B1593|nr:Gfo/Idh/MocA family oxidoreductase [Lacibacter sp.]HLP37615.1 Gfo/Idh/MocA family oxidoreductase [Lacibacter sp.]
MLKAVCVGAGYFSRFQYEAWSRIPEVKIVALCDFDKDKANEMAETFRIASVYNSVTEMLDNEDPDFIDVITPPETHLQICREAFKRKIDVIVQKALAPTLQEASTIVNEAEAAGVRLMVHENFRFQPWYREIKKLLDEKVIGETIFSAYFRMRMGDGWGEDAYLNRQPYFREMERLLVYETGIHFIDTFRYLFGEVKEVYAKLRNLNPVIKGEDAGIVHFEFENGVQAVWDANRYNESNSDNARYTFGEMLIEGDKGSIRLYNNGNISIQTLGLSERVYAYHHQNINFAGDCVYQIQHHFIDCIINNKPFETSGNDYLTNIKVQEAIYVSARENIPVQNF